MKLIIITFLILTIILIICIRNKETFNMIKDCSFSLKINELKYSKSFNGGFPVMPYDDIKEEKPIPKNGEIELKMITITCGDKTYQYYGYHPDDVKKIYPSLVSAIGGVEIVDNVKLVPLLFNEAKNVYLSNLPSSFKQIDIDVKNNAAKIDKFHKFYKEKANLTTNNPSDCINDSDCNGGPDVTESRQGGKCNQNTKKCQCNKGWVGNACQNQDFSGMQQDRINSI